MSDLAIKVENLSKAYQLGDFSTGTLSQDIERWWTLMRGKEDPFLKIGEENDQQTKSTGNVIWSLKDINFEINEGDAVGIIGRNGAGKSTLLKILSRVTSPTTGNVKVKGRIASLLEVGTGFHPELTGRENIFLNGAILGMRKAEIKKHFDAIVDFAGVERYIDTPVKRYSSGMYVRLAFAVAAHLESEILVIDEVLAVGDVEFQKKCLGKMSDVSKQEGRTVLFVSHNMQSILNLCSKGILLVNGKLNLMSNINEVVSLYHNLGRRNSTFISTNSTKETFISNVTFQNNRNEQSNQFEVFSDIDIVIEITSKVYKTNVSIGYGFDNMYENRLFTLYSRLHGKSYTILPGVNTIKCRLLKVPLKPDEYDIKIFVGNDFETIEFYEAGFKLTIIPSAEVVIELPDKTQGSIIVAEQWF